MNALAKKLLIKSGQRWLMLNAPAHFAKLFEALPHGTNFSSNPDGSFSGILIVAIKSRDLAAAMAEIKLILTDETILWCIYPKKNTGHDTDLEMMSSWEVTKLYGLRPVASAAIDKTWTALRFRPEHLVKHSAGSAASIKKQNDYAAYINPDKKQIILPADVAAALTAAPAAMDHFKGLAWSHRKEYLVWILDAKQEKTRGDRIAQMVDKLLAGKKNPPDK